MKPMYSISLELSLKNRHRALDMYRHIMIESPEFIADMNYVNGHFVIDVFMQKEVVANLEAHIGGDILQGYETDINDVKFSREYAPVAKR
ncbi:hypothetical protein GOV11_01260 [Candidatus Woesearchaeota archaeon]|nr:hypothetical protein [Candidatus Woesearchaeota archaeon]